MGLVDTISNLLNRKETPVTTADTKPTASTSNQNYSTLVSRFSIERGRIARVRDSRNAYATDTRPKAIMKRLAADATKGGFQLTVENEQAAEIAGSLRRRLKFDSRLDDWVRLALRDGDTFLELGVTDKREIAVATRKPTLHMRRNSDKTDQFLDPKHAYWYAENINMVEPAQDALWFAEWQIVHARWEHDEGQRYGLPLMSSGRKAFKKIEQGELDIAVRRKLRAGLRYHHTIEGDASDILAYKEQNKAALNDPNIAQADFFSNKSGGIDVIEGDAKIGDINDIIHHIETWWVESPVPRALLGYGRDLNRDILGEQKEQYDEGLPTVQAWVADQIVGPILETQWLLAGILPETLDYTISWQAKRLATPDDILKIAQAAQALRGLGLPNDSIATVLAIFLPGISPDMIELAAVGNTADAARLAKIQQSLGVQHE